MTEPEIRIRVASSLSEVPPAEWNACANPGLDDISSDCGFQAETHNPFLSHAFLHALEASKSVGGRSGWSPAHLLIDGPDGKVAAAVPAYLKSHSQGEYVFDYGWADAYQRAGGDYYPKVQVSVPFTPVTGRRLLVRPGADLARMRAGLLAGLEALRDKTDSSSVHLTFLNRDDWEALGAEGFLQRTDQQFHFRNEGYGTFEDFLTALASRKRKMIRRERKEALAPGISVEWVTGRDITEAHWDAFWAFYMDTGSRKWGRPYLTRKFFSLIGDSMADRILLVMAKRAGRYIAGAINFIGDRALYGRNWGAIEEHPFLHFEVCYYQAIDFAITHKLARVEAGAQGEHKLARGYGPVETYSAHRIADQRLARAVADYLAQERRQVASAIEMYGEHTPFRHEE
ncbi:GNAT family N-acetyltransferase [Lichenifustis flavocetrariae]|uniref:GNAT family N-acetyltransferase n=1 Tax=Lichenifustis flavocetrariae TaxID=2949735 RepID=A0AA41Z2D8_9HYPH|nr:GNAT family N-acetyltransferase [Lichenifustis flavocetrariae]MCW6508022.1 GNAT family N-acetyltransferase [Lichenifustis flavocetrariae]